MENTTNPASRLYEILNNIGKYSGQNLLEKIANYFSIPINNDAEIIGCWLQIYQSFDEIERKLKNIEGIKHSRYVEPLQRLRKVLELKNATSSWSSHINILNPGDLTALDFTAELLSHYHIEEVIVEDELKQFVNDVNDLYESIMNSTLDEKLKNVILDQLELIRRAIHEYRIRGAVRLQEVLATGIGTLVVNKKVFEEASKKDEVQRFAKLLDRLDKIVSIATNAKPLLEPVAKYVKALLSGSFGSS